MSSSVGGVVRTIAVRFGLALGVLFVFPFPLWLIPKTGWLTELVGKPLQWATEWVSQAGFGLGARPPGSSGSGDTIHDYVGVLTMVGLAGLAAIVWTVADRRRPASPRLVAALRVVLRYFLAYMMLSYGFAKILKSQFCDLHPAMLAKPVGEMPPMELMWAFMGASRPYVMFAGLAEAVGGALLLWRRTATIGALLIAVVMTNIVMLNFSYDVCVKLFSTQLLVMAVVIAWPDLRRVLHAALGAATREAPARARMSPRWERARRIAKAALVAAIAWAIYSELSGARDKNDHVHALYGAWRVDRFVVDGVEHPPLLTDGARWRLVALNPTKLVIYSMTGERELALLTVDAAQHSLIVDRDEAAPPRAELQTREVWTYTRPAPDRLVIDGIHHGKHLHVSLHLAPPSRLLTRGFHWINEEPMNESAFNR